LKPTGKFLSFDVRVFENFSIPSQNECCVCVKVDCMNVDKEGTFSPFKCKLAKIGIVGAQSLAVCKNGLIPIRLFNLKENVVNLYKNTLLGKFEVFQNNDNLDLNEKSIHLIDSNDSFMNFSNIIDEKIMKNSNLNDDEKSIAKKTLYEFQDIFAVNKHDYGLCNRVKHEINIKPNTPIQQLIGKVPLNVEQWVDDQVNNLKAKGIIRDSVSPWSAPVVVVKKKNGDFRMCIDYRRLNSVTIRPTFNIPTTQSLFNHLADSKMFSAIDVSNAYHQCEIREEDKYLTAFGTRNGHFEFNRMPFGLVGAPFTFQRLITSILSSENWQICLIYLDDILIFSKNFEDQIHRVKAVLEKIRQSGLKLSLSKCNFFLSEVKYLGHVISADGLKADPDKIEVVKNWPVPATVNHLRRFLGFTNYYRKYIQGYANFTESLEQVLKDSCKSKVKRNDESKLLWSSKGLNAFSHLKQALCSTPCLAFPQGNSTFILDTDASFETIGCVLSQVQDGEEKVIAYGSKKLSRAEIQYCITRKELLAVYYFVTYHRQLLLGRRFLIRTDHRALTWLLNWKSPNTTQYCSWVAELEIYDFDIEHRKGKDHINADFVSRPFENCKQCELSHPDPRPKRNVKIFQISEPLEQEIRLEKLHKTLGHIGEEKLLNTAKNMNIENRYLKQAVHNVVSKCFVCLERKYPGRKSHQQASYFANYPFEKVAIDIAGPLQPTQNNNAFLLSIIDVFSRWIVLVPLKRMETCDIINALESHWIPSFGLPKILISDGARNFCSFEMESFLKSKNVLHHVTSAYHPQSNGLIERYFRTVKDMLYATAKSEGKFWDEVLGNVTLGLRASKNISVKFSPFEIVYGFLPKLDSHHDITCPRNNAVEIWRELRSSNNLIIKNNEKYSHKFHVGDKVLVKSGKDKVAINEQRYFGPGQIVACKPHKSYVVVLNGKELNRHEDHLKKFPLIDRKTNKSTTTSIKTRKDIKVKRTKDFLSRYPKRERQKPIKFGFTLNEGGCNMRK